MLLHVSHIMLGGVPAWSNIYSSLSVWSTKVLPTSWDDLHQIHFIDCYWMLYSRRLMFMHVAPHVRQSSGVKKQVFKVFPVGTQNDDRRFPGRQITNSNCRFRTDCCWMLYSIFSILMHVARHGRRNSGLKQNILNIFFWNTKRLPNVQDYLCNKTSKRNLALKLLYC